VYKESESNAYNTKNIFIYLLLPAVLLVSDIIFLFTLFCCCCCCWLITGWDLCVAWCCCNCDAGDLICVVLDDPGDLFGVDV
jgi:hypothetical protein